MTSKRELLQLQKQWYSKLKREGFKDIEWTEGHSINGVDSPYLKDTAFKYKKKFNEHTAEHYRLMRNFSSNYTFKSKMDAFIFELYCEGCPFREIVHKVYRAGWNQRRPGPPKPGKTTHISKISLFTLHHILKKYIKLAYEWNKTDPEGLLLATESVD